MRIIDNLLDTALNVLAESQKKSNATARYVNAGGSNRGRGLTSLQYSECDDLQQTFGVSRCIPL